MKKIRVGLVTEHFVNVENLKVDDIDIEDISWGLSGQIRYNGQLALKNPKTLKRIHVHYSIAEHSVFVARVVKMLVAEDDNWTEDQKRMMVFAAALHDAPEYVLGDMISPLKHNGEYEHYIALENKIEYTVYEKFGLVITPEMRRVIKHADNIVYECETKYFRPWALTWIPEYTMKLEDLATGRPGLSPSNAKRMFDSTIKKLSEGKWLTI